jgi:hypothetical protein
MTDLNDLKLDKWQGSTEPEPARRSWVLPLVALALVGLAAAGYYFYQQRAAAPPADVRAATDQAVAQPPATVPGPSAEPGDVIDLPPLPETDSIVRELVAKLSSHPTVAAWLTTDQLLRNFTVVVETIAGGRTPSRQLGKIRPAGGFQVREERGRVWIDPRSYRRYDAYGDAVSGLDAQATARLYATLKPRIADAYRELGHPDGNLDPALRRAIGQLLEVPVVDGDIALTSKSVAYEFADPRLQSLSSAQRQLLRMGPRNVRLIQAKLREIAPYLGIPADSLPKPR